MIERLAAHAAGATRTVTPFAVLPPLAAADPPEPTGPRVGAGEGTVPSQRGGSSRSGNVDGAATGTAEPLKRVQADEAVRKPGAAADSRAREQTLVFIGQDLDKVRVLDATLFERHCVTCVLPRSRSLGVSRIPVALGPAFTRCGDWPDHVTGLNVHLATRHVAWVCSYTVCLQRSLYSTVLSHHRCRLLGRTAYKMCWTAAC